MMRRHMHVILAILFTSINATLIFAQTWCGKNYMANQTVIPPGGQFVLPLKSVAPLLAFRCAPAFRPYLEQDGHDATIVVDTRIVYDWIEGADPIVFSNGTQGLMLNGDTGNGLSVTIRIDGVHTTHKVPLNVTGFEVPIDISPLEARQEAYKIDCWASYKTSDADDCTQKFFAPASLLYLPDTEGSVTKMDLRTGSLWARPANGSGGAFQQFIPQGFYVTFQDLAANLSIIDQLKADGFNTIHPIPPYDNLTIFEQALNRTVEFGLYVIFDMRSSYQNLTAVKDLVNTYKSIPNLLTWETAHEPDGNSDPFGAAKATYDLIYELDGYHPISIVLNCEDYNFTPYVEGADIVLEDAYPIGINATFSPVWNTSCTPDFGHCGCDNCKGGLIDIRSRIQIFKDRLDILGYERTKVVWSTPQAFGSGAYWSTTPTGQQWAAIDLLSANHGAMGWMSFRYPTTTGRTAIEGTAPAITSLFSTVVQSFVGNPKVTNAMYFYNGVDAGLWYNGTAYLLLVANTAAAEVIVPWSAVGLGAITNATAQIQRLLSVSQNFNATGLNFLPVGIGMYTATPP